MADKSYTKVEARHRRHSHILKTLRGSAERPRLVIFRSNKHIYAQVVDDLSRTTLFAASTLTPAIRDVVAKAKSKKEQAMLVGKHLAEIAKDKEVTRIVFDRGGYLYHGRVKALADGAREGGLQF
ncbi:MAG TPA: 50S ribosomal protein L18 [bacterium]|nr:50S ribosomal protein L18 [bacterium]